MTSIRIFAIFLIFILFSTAIPALRGEISLSPRNAIDRDLSNGEDINFLRAALYRINQLARRSQIKRQNTRVLFRIGAKSWQLYSGSRQKLVVVPGTHLQWKKSFDMRRKLYSIMFYCRFNLQTTTFAELRLLPVWICAAIDEAMSGKENSEQYHSGNKDYSALRTMVKITGKLPDFTVLPSFDQIPENSAERTVFFQMSRLFIEILAEQKQLPKLLEFHRAAQPDDHYFSIYSSRREAQAQLSDHAMKILFSRRDPLPVKMMHKKLDELTTITIPELDKSSAPTGNMLTLTFEQANTLLHNSKRPDIAEIRRHYVNKCRQFGRHGSMAISKLLHPLIRVVAAIGEDEDLPLQFAEALNAIRQQLNQEQRIENTFLHHYFIRQPAYQLYRHHLLLHTSGAWDTMTEHVQHYLEKSEKEYLKNY